MTEAQSNDSSATPNGRNPPPREWVEPSGHRVVRLSEEAGSSSLYFNFNAYISTGELVISTPTGISRVDLATRNITPILTVDESFSFLFVGKHTDSVYFKLTETNTICRVSIETGISTVITSSFTGDIQAINADETLLAGVEVDPGSGAEILKVFEKRDPKTDQFVYEANWPDGTPMAYADAKEVRLNQRLEAKIPMTMFVVDISTGQRRDVYKSTDWLNHLLFSPTDPNLLMFCHEGPWHKVDRLWLLDLEVGTPKRIHERRMNMEIAGHEWFSHDGQTIWYDLQTPRGEDFWVAGYEIKTGERTQYHLLRDEWSVHFHSSPDNKLFSGDGGDSEMVAHAKDGKYLYLFTPNAIPDVAGIQANDSASLVTPGYLSSEKLVDLADHDYRLEPNANFTPDSRYLVFRSNMHGEMHVYAVDTKPEKGKRESE